MKKANSFKKNLKSYSKEHMSSCINMSSNRQYKELLSEIKDITSLNE